MQGVARTVASVIAGAVAAPYLIWCWGQIAGRGLVFDPLFDAGLRGGWLHAAIGTLDFFASLAVLLPLALLLRGLGPSGLVVRTVLAAGAIFAVSSIIVGLPGWPSTWHGLASHLSPHVALFAGVWICSAIARRLPNRFIPARDICE